MTRRMAAAMSITILATAATADAQRYFARQKLGQIGNGGQASSNGPKPASCPGLGPRTYLTSSESGLSSYGTYATRSEAIKVCESRATLFYNDPNVDPNRHFYGCQIVTNDGKHQLLTTGGAITSKVVYTYTNPMYDVWEGVPCTAG